MNQTNINQETDPLLNAPITKCIFPDAWLVGIIRHIYKNADIGNPENYRPITLLSCLGKLFTAILNKCITLFLETNEQLFRKYHSTVDHIFTLYGLIELLKTRKKHLYCTLIDFKKAFDSVWKLEC